MKRKVIKIDEEKCNGCGLCVPSCAEGALQIVDGKARLVSDKYCDGLGACLGECPEGALVITEREAEEFDEKAVDEYLKETKRKENSSGRGMEFPCSCPSSVAKSWKKDEGESSPAFSNRLSSQLRQWPVQLTLVNPNADFFKEAELVVAADCVPFAYANFHQDFLKGKALVVGCPKLDDYKFYLDKLTEIIRRNSLKKILVVTMEVPCCFGLINLIREALSRSGKEIPVEQTVIGIRGDALFRKKISSLLSGETVNL